MARVGRLLWIGLFIVQCSTVLAQYTEFQAPTVPKPKRSKKTTVSFQEFLKGLKKQALNFEYYPNYGYEPYWADGEWMLATSTDPHPEIKKDDTTIFAPKACGTECNHLFKKVMHVCARKVEQVKRPADGCGDRNLFLKVAELWAEFLPCEGKPGHNYNAHYTTYNTYCEFLAAQCKLKFTEEHRWILAYVGKCEDVDKWFHPIWEGFQPVSRQEFYLASFHDTRTSTVFKTGKGMGY